MTTTHLFVELLVIGFGALAWVVILAAAIFGYDLTSLKDSLFSLGALFPILSLVYVFGILTDRIADWIFELIWGDRHFQQVYEDGNKSEYFKDRRLLIIEGPELWQFLEYGRSRLRICRGWAMNSALLVPSFWIYYGLTKPDLCTLQLSAITAAILVLTIFCWMSWSKLNRKEYEKIQRQAEWVVQYRDKNKKQDIGLTGSLSLEGIEKYETDREGSSPISD